MYSLLTPDLVINSQLTTIEDVYGISKSNLKPTKDSEELCLICFTEPINTIIRPCNHMSICNQCAQLMKTKSTICPMCRTEIKSFLTLSSA
jgi:E3 ubiquitin-protein ligase MGRN1